MAVITNRGVFPQVDYGQGDGAWSPASRAPVYQQINLARHEPSGAFAQAFAADAMFGMKGVGEYYYREATRPIHDHDGTIIGVESYLAAEKASSGGYLYNRNTLNAASSWVAQAFSPPVVREGSVWRNAGIVVQAAFIWPGMTVTWGFAGIEDTVDAFVLRMLNGGHYAFSALGDNGVRVYLPWAGGYEPRKSRRGTLEARNEKVTYG